MGEAAASSGMGSSQGYGGAGLAPQQGMTQMAGDNAPLKRPDPRANQLGVSVMEAKAMARVQVIEGNVQQLADERSAILRAMDEMKRGAGAEHRTVMRPSAHQNLDVFSEHCIERAELYQSRQRAARRLIQLLPIELDTDVQALLNFWISSITV